MMMSWWIMHAFYSNQR